MTTSEEKVNRIAQLLPLDGRRFLAADAAEYALLNERNDGRRPDGRSWRAVGTARAYARGGIDNKALFHVMTSAVDAAEAAKMRSEALLERGLDETDARLNAVWACEAAAWSAATASSPDIAAVRDGRALVKGEIEEVGHDFWVEWESDGFGPDDFLRLPEQAMVEAAKSVGFAYQATGTLDLHVDPVGEVWDWLLARAVDYASGSDPGPVQVS